jgi:hypothetical protein
MLTNQKIFFSQSLTLLSCLNCFGLRVSVFEVSRLLIIVFWLGVLMRFLLWGFVSSEYDRGSCDEFWGFYMFRRNFYRWLFKFIRWPQSSWAFFRNLKYIYFGWYCFNIIILFKINIFGVGKSRRRALMLSTHSGYGGSLIHNVSSVQKSCFPFLRRSTIGRSSLSILLCQCLQWTLINLLFLFNSFDTD